MGIAISYKGKLDDPARLDAFLQDIKSQCAIFEWPCDEVRYPVSGVAWTHGHEEQVPQPDGSSTVTVKMDPKLMESEIRGLNIHVPGTETFRLTFNSEGELKEYYEIPDQMLTEAHRGGEPQYMESELWVKTTGQVESHVLIVILLKGIRKRYMSNLQVQDDTGFYDTMDFDQLRREHAVMGMFISTFSDPKNAAALLEAAGQPVKAEDLKPLNPDLPLRQPKPKAGKSRAAKAN